MKKGGIENGVVPLTDKAQGSGPCYEKKMQEASLTGEVRFKEGGEGEKRCRDVFP